MSYVILATQPGAAHLNRRTDSKWWNRKHGQDHPFGTCVTSVHAKHFNFFILKKGFMDVPMDQTFQ